MAIPSFFASSSTLLGIIKPKSMDGSLNTTRVVVPLLAEILLEEASQSWPDLISIFCANVLLIWDIIVTFDLEMELVWRAPKCVITYLFLFSRYVTLSQVIVTMALLQGDFKSEHNICRVYVWYYAFSTVFLLWAVDILLAYRAYAFCGRDRRILIFLITLGVLNGGAIMVMSIFTIMTFSIFHSTALVIPGVIGECVATNFPRLLHYTWISEIIFQSILFFLVVGRFIQQTVISWNKIANISSLYLIVARDGVWVYVLLLGVFSASATQTNLVGLSLPQWGIVFAEIGGSRLVLNLRSLKTPHTSSEDYIVSLPRWAGRQVTFDTIHESVDDIALSQGSTITNTMELSSMGRGEESLSFIVDSSGC